MDKDFAIIATGGKQYRVSAGDKLKVEKLPTKAGAPLGDAVSFDKVLLTSMGGAIVIGTPHVAGAKVEAKVLHESIKDKTKIIMKYHSKTRQHKKKGHRQPHTEIEITKI